MPVVPPLVPGPSGNELRNQRLNTRAFIAANPSVVILVPRTPQKSGTGVKLIDGEPRPAQVGRLIDLGTTDTISNVDASQVRSDFQLLLAHDGEVARNDYWEAEGFRFEVAEVLPENYYERRASVVRYG